MRTSDSPGITETKLRRIAWLSEQDRHRQFDNLIHHVNESSLKECFYHLSGDRAVGVDGITKAEYGANLDENLRILVDRMKDMAYRPQPVRQVLIPKEGNGKAMRPLGISSFEDKLVQKMMQRILESVYEPLFLDCSYGFRRGRGCHDAIKALQHHLYKNEVQAVVDVDISRYFDTIDHEQLLEFLKLKIGDKRFIRYIVRMFKSGVLSDGELRLSDEGVPQGSVCSPILANIFAHYVIDEWFEDVVKAHCSGKVEMFRYADDIVICCQYEDDAKRILTALQKRLENYGLKLNQEKTRIVSFSKRAYSQGIGQGTFDFLGFTFYLGDSRKGTPIPKVKSSGKRLGGKLKRVNAWARSVRNSYRLAEVWNIFCSKLRGHVQYYGVSFNVKHVQKFIHQAKCLLFKWLNRRSQRRSINWEAFLELVKEHPLPRARVCHSLF